MSNVQPMVTAMMIPYWVDDYMTENSVSRSAWYDGDTIWDLLPETAVMDTLACNINTPDFLNPLILTFNATNKITKNKNQDIVKQIFSSNIFTLSGYFDIDVGIKYPNYDEWCGGCSYNVIQEKNRLYIILGPQFDNILRGSETNRWMFFHHCYKEVWKNSSNYAPHELFSTIQFTNHMKTSKFRS